MSNSVGAQFYPVDFHVHTPASQDYKDKHATAREIVDVALHAGLAAIAITDHNTLTGIDKVREAATGTQLVVFPGVEITAQGGHIIALFDPLAPTDVVEKALYDAGIPKSQWGQETALGKDFITVLSAIINNGGLAIAAHADGPKGFLTTIQQGQTNIKIYSDPNLAAIELVSLDKKDQYIEGKLPGYDRAIACVQGSDAHLLSQVGSRCVLVRMHHLSLEGVRQAFAFPKMRIRFPSEWSIQKYPYIVSLTVNQGFLKGQTLAFNSNLNCIVGGAGSGKSTVIEFLRFVLDQVSTLEHIAEDNSGKLRDLAQLGATIDAIVELESGEQLSIRRTFNDADNPIVVRRIADGHLLDDVDVRKMFPVHAYSQGEVISISRSPLAQLELIDKHLDLHQFQYEIRDAYRQLGEQSVGLARLEAVARDRETFERDIATVKAQIDSRTSELNTLLEAQQNPVVVSHQLWIAEKNYLSELINTGLPKAKREIEERMDDIDLHSVDLALPSENIPNRILLEECRRAALRINDVRRRVREELLSTLAVVEGEIRNKAQEWKAQHAKHEAEYQKYRDQLGETRTEKINAQLEMHRDKMHKSQVHLENIKEAEKTRSKLLQKRAELLKLVKDRRDRIFTLREHKAKEIVKRIGDRVALKVVANGNTDEYAQAVSELLKGSHAQKEVVQKICSCILPDILVALLREENFQEIDNQAQIGEKWAKALVEQAKGKPESVYDLEAASIEDRIDISLKIEQGKYRELHRLSTGQKATVIVLLSMVVGKHPIIFDQPEDALYTPFIYTDVVKTLKAEKDQRQFVLATHNPNISVAADMDLGIVLESTATETMVQAVGGLDDKNTQKLMVWHLEGGEEAFLSRHKRYGLS